MTDQLLPFEPFEAPPSRLAGDPDDPDDLPAAAAASLWPRRVRAFCDYIGRGRPLTGTGNLRLADAKSLAALLESDASLRGEIRDLDLRVRSAAELDTVDLTRQLAERVGYVAVQGPRLVRLPDAQELLDDPVAAWGHLLTALLALVGPHQHRWRDDPYGWGWWAPTADEALATALLAMADKHEALDVAAFCDAAWQQATEDYDLDGVEPHVLDFHRDNMANQLRTIGFTRLAEMGAVVLDEVADTVRLSPLARQVLERISREGGDLIMGMPAAELVEASLDLPLPLAVTQISAWADAHPRGAGELVDAVLSMADGPFAPMAAGLVLHALRAAGPTAAEDVERLRVEPELAVFVTAWRLAVGLDPGPLPSLDQPERLVDVLAAVCILTLGEDADVVLDRAVRPVGLLPVIDAVWRVRRDEAELVLRCLSELDEKTVAKAARTALFKRQSLPPVKGEIELRPRDDVPRQRASQSRSRSQHVAQLKVTLRGAKPPIWRRVLVPYDIRLSALADVLIAGMGWEDAHLHEFRVGEDRYSRKDFELMTPHRDETRTALSSVLSRTGDKMRFEYDFGDGWRHDVVLEKLLDPETGVASPTVVDGRRACPPEDCGGVWGYADLVDAYADPGHERHEDARDWLGEDFSPEQFDLEAAAEAVRGLKVRVR